MSSLTTLFKNEPESQEDSDKLLDLFKNRAELKKEFAELRNEKFRLQDRIKEHQGAIVRVQQKLSHLESLLLDPDWVHNVVVFYQFRRLGTHCNARLERFAEELKQQREKRAHNKVLVAWNERRKQDAERVQRRIGEQRMQLQTLEDRLQAEQRRLQSMGGVEKMLRGRSQSVRVEEVESDLAAARATESEMLQELAEIEHLEPPAHQGLDIATKRSINFMILSFVQQLYLQYQEDGLAAMAKEASEKSVGAINYGSKADCDELLERISRRKTEVENQPEPPEILQRRAQLIAEHALYRNDEDAVPESGSVATLFRIDANGVVRTTDANLLGENYFNVTKILSR